MITRSLIILICCASSLSLKGQATDGHRFDHKIVAGYNFGATAPIPIPAEVRAIDAWWPQFSGKIGYNAIYNINDRWGLGAGILMEAKGMGVKDKVKYIHTRVFLSKEDIVPLEGYFVGKNETRVSQSYLTVPIFAMFHINQKWSLKAGGYLAYMYSGEFDGTVSDGYLRVGTPTGERIDIDEATFNFNEDLRRFDFGVTFGTEYNINHRFGVFGNLEWGLRPIFDKDSRPMGFNMYNIYFAAGLTYNLFVSRK